MALKKTTVAQIKSLRINPGTSQEDADVMAIIERLESEGYSFKQIVQDAILRADGRTPEMYSHGSTGFLLGGIEELLSKFASEILSSGKSFSAGNAVATDEDITPFAKQFAKSFMQRQQSKGE